MGTYLNPGSEKFAMMLNSAIYVDKTAMLAELNMLVRTAQRYLCVSRPRRFGKSVATDMLCAYYGKDVDCRELFEGRAISSCDDWDMYLGQFDVVYLNIADCLAESADAKDMVDYITEEVTEEIAAKYSKCILGKRSSLRSVMNDVYNKSGSQFVVIIDEWDVIFREFKDDLSGQKEYLAFLRNWLKDKPYIAMAYMTGILPIKKYGQHSALNMFDEYSMLSPMQLAPYTGFTEEEVQSLCQEYGVDFSKIKEWYDGYIVTSEIPVSVFPASKNTGKVRQPARAYHLYSPLSVVKAVSTGHIRNYWNKTETYEALAEYIRMDFDGLKETVAELMDGMHVHVNLGTYKNDMTSFQYKDDILALLIHLGYLGYDELKEEVFIPNREILDEYKNSTLSPEWSTTFKTLQNSQRLLEATWACDGKLLRN